MSTKGAKAQIGINADPTKNAVLETQADGTFVIRTGSLGTPGTTLATFSAAPRTWHAITLAPNTDRVNNTGKRIFVRAVVNAVGAQLSATPVVGGISLPTSLAINSTAFCQATMSFPVDPGVTYRINTSGGAVSSIEIAEEY